MSQSTGIRSTRQLFSWAIIAIGALLMASVPLYFLLLTFTGTHSGRVSGTLVVGSAGLGMMLVLVGAAFRD